MKLILLLSIQALYLAQLVHEAGIPAGIVNVVSGLGQTGALLSEHMEIRKLSFTGSTRTGRLSQWLSFLFTTQGNADQ
jgi:aldehyde dehydrogenase (NAD+)